MDGTLTVAVLRRRSELSAVAGECVDLALHCAEPSRLDQPRHEGTRCVLVWINAHGTRRLGALFPFGGPAFYRALPLLALSSGTPLVRVGWERACLHALFEWFRQDGEGAALLEFRALARGGPIYRACAEVARQREQLVLAGTAADGSRTLLIGDRTWGELTRSTLPLARWAKRGVAAVVYGQLDF
jgi:hypothetical protein